MFLQVLDRAQRFGSGLILEGAEPNPGQFIGIFSQNCIEWKVAEQACNSFSMVVVTLYDTLGPEAIQHIVNQCKLNTASAMSSFFLQTTTPNPNRVKSVRAPE